MQLFFFGFCLAACRIIPRVRDLYAHSRTFLTGIECGSWYIHTDENKSFLWYSLLQYFHYSSYKGRFTKYVGSKSSWTEPCPELDHHLIRAAAAVEAAMMSLPNKHFFSSFLLRTRNLGDFALVVSLQDLQNCHQLVCWWTKNYNWPGKDRSVFILLWDKWIAKIRHRPSVRHQGPP